MVDGADVTSKVFKSWSFIILASQVHSGFGPNRAPGETTGFIPEAPPLGQTTINCYQSVTYPTPN